MAVTLSLEQLMVEMRLSASPEETSIATRLLDTCTDMVQVHLGSAYAGARESAVNEAVVRLASYLYEMPVAGGDGFANAMRNSGAGRVLLPYRVHRAGYADTMEAANEAVGTVGNPVTGINVSGTTLTVTFADGASEEYDLPSGGGGGGVDQVARDAAQAAQSDADAAGSVAQAASGAATTALNTAHTAQATGDAASGEIADHETNHPRQGTRVIIDTQEPAGSGFQLDDIWIRDAQFPSTLQLYRWTGSVWSVDYTLPSEINSVEMWARVNNSAKIPGAKTGVYLLPPGGTLPVPTETLFNENAAASLDGVWYYIAEHGHAASSNLWTWDDLNDGRVDLAQWRGVVSENPFSIQNPQTLDWAYISGEHRWVRRNSSTWVYTSAPAQYDSRYRSQHAAQQGGLIAVGKFIFVSSGHKMRVIRSYQGNAPGPTLYAWIAHDGPTLDLEDWAYRNNDVRIQPRKLADFGGHSINQIPDDGEQWYTLRARVHKNVDGSLISYDLADWTEEVIPEPSSGGASAYPPFYQATSSGAFTLTSTDSVIPGMTLPAVNFVAGEQWRFTATVALNGIGDTPHDLRVSLNIAGNAWVNVESREDDETSPSKFNVLIDHVITIPAGGGDVDVRAREASRERDNQNGNQSYRRQGGRTSRRKLAGRHGRRRR